MDNLHVENLNKNIKFLRKSRGQTQEAFAGELGIKRSLLGAYEEGRARPNLATQLAITRIFGISLDRLVKEDLERSGFDPVDAGEPPESGVRADGVRVLAITVDERDEERIVLVPERARAGYTAGYGDPEYIAELPLLQLPFLPAGSYRAFEVSGDSMLPVQPGTIIVGTYVSDFSDLKDGATYVLLTQQDGVVYKRLFRKSGSNRNRLVLQSDNPSYPPYELAADEVLEAWEAKLSIGKVSRQQDVSIDSMMGMLARLRSEVDEIRRKKD